MADYTQWRHTLEDFRAQQQLSYDRLADALSNVCLCFCRDAHISQMSSAELHNYATQDLRVPKRRSRHLALIEAFVKLGFIEEVEVANKWLAMADMGYLSPREYQGIFKYSTEGNLNGSPNGYFHDEKNLEQKWGQALQGVRLEWKFVTHAEFARFLSNTALDDDGIFRISKATLQQYEAGKVPATRRRHLELVEVLAKKGLLYKDKANDLLDLGQMGNLSPDEEQRLFDDRSSELTQFTIIMDADYDDPNINRKIARIKQLCASENIELTIREIRKGSVLLLSELPLEQLPRLLELLKSGKLGNLGVVDITLKNADLRYIDLAEKDLSGLDLSGADLRDANLRGANLTGASLTDCRLTGAYLRDANLHRADLRGAKLQRAVLHGAGWQQAQYDETTEWPEGFNIQRSSARASSLQGLESENTKEKQFDVGSIFEQLAHIFRVPRPARFVGVGLLITFVLGLYLLATNPTVMETLRSLVNDQEPPIILTPLPPTDTDEPLVTPTPEAGATKIHPADNAVYVYIPAGDFIVGSTEEEIDQAVVQCEEFIGTRCPKGRFDESPASTVSIDSFWIMQTEVTNEQYGRCIEAGVCTIAPENQRWSDANYAQHPVHKIDYYQAVQYAQWVEGRLPTEAEWEKVCRGPERNTYPWGEDMVTIENSNFAEYLPDSVGDTTIVGSYPAGVSPYGVFDLVGNVWEWTSSLGMPYPYQANDGRENASSDGDRVLRGGGFANDDYHGHCAYRRTWPSDFPDEDLGFRLILANE